MKKKKLLATVLASALACGTLSGCGGTAQTSGSATSADGSGKTVKVFQLKEEVKKYIEELNMNPNLINRDLNVGFSGGEKKKNEILQLLVLNPKLAILDETDSGLDVDAIRTVSKGINLYKNEENAVLIITHNTRILQNLKVDYVHILVDGKIVKTGSSELAEEIEKEGYGKYKNEN